MKWLWQLIFALILTINVSQIKAGNVIGAEIHVSQLTGSKLKVTLIKYNNCGTYAYSDNKIKVEPKNGKSFYIQSTSADFQRVSPLSNEKCNNCYCATFYYIDKTEYEAIVDLSKYTDCEFTFSWHGKNNSLYTFSTGADVYVETKINRCITGTVNTPKFATDPFFNTCENQCVSTFLSAFNSGNDSFSYTLAPPQIDSVTNYIYPKSYSYKQPFNYNGYPSVKDTFIPSTCKGFYLNPQTAELNFQAIKPDWDINYISLRYIAVKCSQYQPDSNKKMKIVSEATRLMAVMIFACASNNLPHLVKAIPKDTFICAENDLSLNFIGFSSTPGDKIYIDGKFDMPYAAFYQDTSMSSKTTGTLKWQIKKDYISQKPYQLIISVYNRYSAFTRTNQKLYNIYVVSPKPDLSIIQNENVCGNFTLSVAGDTDQIAKYQWFVNNVPFSTEKNPAYKVNKNGEYIFKLLATNKAKCVTEVLGDSFTVTFLPNIDLGTDIFLCPGQSATLNATADSSYTYFWQPDSAIANNTSASPKVTPKSSSTYIVTAKNASGCTVTDTIMVTVAKFEISVSNDTSICPGNTIALRVSSDADLKYTWSPSAGIADYENDTLFIRPLKTTTYIVTAKNAFGCSKSDSIKVIVNISKANAGDDVQICKGGIGTTITGKGGYYYTWLNNRGDTLSKSSDLYVNPLSTEEFYLVSEDSLRCQSSTDNIIVFVSTLPLEIIKDTTICEGDTLLLWSDGGDIYKWNSENTLINGDTKTPLVFPIETTTYTVTIYDTTKQCSDTRSVKISVNKDCVWPGDANKDGIVDHLDVLEIGVGYGSTGPYRIDGNTQWESAVVKDWNNFTYNNINYKHLDCNGDGNIDAADNFVISENYGKTRASTYKSKLPEPANNRRIFFEFDKDTLYAGEIVRATLRLGDNNSPVTNAYGIGYKYSFTDYNIVPGTYSFTPVCDAICTGNDFVLQSVKNYASENTTEASMVRSDHIKRSANGSLAKIEFILLDSTHNYSGDGKWIYLRLHKTKLMDNIGGEHLLNMADDSALVLRSKYTSNIGASEEESIFGRLNIYPNPSRNYITIESDKSISGEIQITNALGQLTEKVKMLNQRSVMIDTKHFPAGIYMVNINTATNQQKRIKFIIIK